jgi:hypothetical protein
MGLKFLFRVFEFHISSIESSISCHSDDLKPLQTTCISLYQTTEEARALEEEAKAIEDQWDLLSTLIMNQAEGLDAASRKILAYANGLDDPAIAEVCCHPTYVVGHANVSTLHCIEPIVGGSDFAA